MKAFAPLIQLRVVVDGKRVQEYHKDDHTFVEGRQGSSFTLALKNLTGKKILVHPTVDGLSAMTGKEASRFDNTDGYVLFPFQELDIPGWRLNDDEVARFFFAGGGGSYAEKTGKSKDKGVIACSVWEEKVAKRQTRGILRGASGQSWGKGGPRYGGGRGSGQCMGFSPDEDVVTCAVPAGAADVEVQTSCAIEPEMCTYGGETKSASTCNLGAGFGEATTHEVQSIYFVAATENPIATAVIYYDDAEGLQARGISLKRHGRSHALPNPFPKDRSVDGCTPPKGWRG